MILAATGYDVITAEDGLAGFEAARREQPDVILLDVVMPVMDGLELLLKLRSDLLPPLPPVILCSGFDLTEDEALRRGAARFLRKPVETADLLEAVRDALARRTPPSDAIRRQHEHAAAGRRQVLDAATGL